MLEIKTLLKQSSHYFAGRSIIIIAGFISFPILTRILSVKDYGMLGIITTTLAIITAVTKLGIQESVIRFYSEYNFNKALDKYYSTILFGSISCSLIVSIIFALTNYFILRHSLDNSYFNVLYIVSILIFIKCINDILNTFLRAEQDTKLYNLVEIFRRYGSFSIGVVFVMLIMEGVEGYLYGAMITGIIVLFYLLYRLYKKNSIKITNFSKKSYFESVRYGFPLIWNEIGALSLNYIDRFFIQYYLGQLSLGLYTAAYNFTTYFMDLIVYPINYALTPICMKTLAEKGEEETREFLSETFTYFLAIAIPASFGLIIVGKDLLAVLASKKYVEAYIILPYVAVGQLLRASTLILNSGLFIRKKTHMVTIITLGTGLLNVGLNLILIPRFGILGAAQSTLTSYLLYFFIITHFSFREFSFRIEYRRICVYIIAAICMLVTLIGMDFGIALVNIISKIGIGTVLYSLLVIMFDAKIRQHLLSLARTMGKI